MHFRDILCLTAQIETHSGDIVSLSVQKVTHFQGKIMFHCSYKKISWDMLCLAAQTETHSRDILCVIIQTETHFQVTDQLETHFQEYANFNCTDRNTFPGDFPGRNTFPEIYSCCIHMLMKVTPCTVPVQAELSWISVRAPVSF